LPAFGGLGATPSGSSPPIAISASSPSAAKFSSRSFASSGFLYGFVREVWRIVPPRWRMPDTAFASSSTVSRVSIPRQPWRMPRRRNPRGIDRLATARITALSPGASPPPVRIPTVFIAPPVRALVYLSRPIETGGIVRRQLHEAVGGPPLGRAPPPFP